MALPFKIKVRWGYVVAFLMLLISYFLIFYIIRQVARESKWVRHSYKVINTLESVRSGITDAETGVRGYIISRDVRFLHSYNTGSRETLSQFEAVKRLTADNQSYRGLLDTLESLLHRRLQHMGDGLKSFQTNGYAVSEEMLLNRDVSRVAMDSVRLLVEDLQEKEHFLMNERSDTLNSFFTSTKVIAITSFLIAVLTIIFSLVIYNRESEAREAAASRAQIYSQELEEGMKQLKKVNDELEQLKSIEKFAATGRIARTIAHEVRNPLTNISLAAEQLKEMTRENEDAGQLIDMVARNVNRINQLVSDLLNSTRFAQLEYSPGDINQLMDEALVQAKDSIELKQAKVEKQYGEAMDPVPVDREKMRMVFLNIIVNALEAMEAGKGVLTIRTHQHGTKFTVEIKDNGSGMDEETQQKVFEPYFTTKMKGNGLGMTNTQNIIFNHKGSISVKSSPGQGSSFIITLPLIPQE